MRVQRRGEAFIGGQEWLFWRATVKTFFGNLKRQRRCENAAEEVGPDKENKKENVHLGQGVRFSTHMFQGCFKVERKQFSFWKLYMGRICKSSEVDSTSTELINSWMHQLMCAWNLIKCSVEGTFGFIRTRENFHRKDQYDIEILKPCTAVFNYNRRLLAGFLAWSPAVLYSPRALLQKLRLKFNLI